MVKDKKIKAKVMNNIQLLSDKSDITRKYLLLLFGSESEDINKTFNAIDELYCSELCKWRVK